MCPDFEILPNVNRLQWDEKLLFEMRYIGFNLISRIISFDNLPQSQLLLVLPNKSKR